MKLGLSPVFIPANDYYLCDDNCYSLTSTHIKMGKGDKRTKKGKRWSGSYGNSRPKPEDEKKHKKEEKQKNS